MSIVFALLGRSAFAQPPDLAGAQARGLLQAPDLPSKASGAFLAGVSDDPSVQTLLVSALRDAGGLNHVTPDSSEYAYVQSLFDALITLGAPVPGDAIRPFLSSRPAECLILLARSPAQEDDLLAVRRAIHTEGEWFAVNSLLLRARSGQFLADMIECAGARHDFYVTDHDHVGGVPGVGDGRLFPAVRPESVRKFPDRFPPIGLYDLFLRWPNGFAGAGDVVLLGGRYPVFYRRTVVPKKGSVTWPERLELAFGGRYACMDFLADASGMDTDSVRALFTGTSTFKWTNQSELDHVIREALEAQAAAIQAGIQRLVESAKRSGFNGIPHLRIQIRPRLLDLRQGQHDQLPTPPAHSLAIN